MLFNSSASVVMAELMDSSDFQSNDVVRPPITKVYVRKKKFVRRINLQERPKVEEQEIQHLGFDQSVKKLAGKKVVRKINLRERPKVEVQESDQHLGFDQTVKKLVGKKRKRRNIETSKPYDDNELLFLAESFDYCQDLEPANIIWAKVTGHPNWPAVILNDSTKFVGKLRGLNKKRGDLSLLVQFFGTHEFARVKRIQLKPFLEGLASGFHHKCKKAHFITGLDEAKTYLNEQKLPKTMSVPGNGVSYKASKVSRVSLNYKPIDIKRSLDKCDVCEVDEECENNLFLQCDKCRIMVHPRCYGELEASEGALWLCKLCRPGAPAKAPPCCLCPVTGGAMKRTTDGRWAHLACVIWIPETCFADIKKMEPIDGIAKISKDRWKLLCCICGVPHGACVQCSKKSCCVAYHPLCARAAGFHVDVEEKGETLKLVSFCRKHGTVLSDGSSTSKMTNFLEYSPPINPSGCARTEPYTNHLGRRGRKEPEALAAASSKRLYVENVPHLVGGFSRHEPCDLETKPCQQGISSMAEKYRYMKETVKKRLAFGKSGIHGFGVFAKHHHRAGDMMIEYVGEIVRSSIADRRERVMYNSMVGAGTYMFKVDDERVVDATRAGSMAHLINHSCDPNCYSRMIRFNGDEHIIIFAKRDISQWEELTYDYRFCAVDEVLACYCGVQSCHGVVNDPEANERGRKLYVPCSQLIDWNGE